MAQKTVQEFLQGPALPPPPGEVSVLDGTPGFDAIYIATLVVSLVVTLSVILMRIFVKHRITRDVGWDCYMMGVAYAFWIAFVVSVAILRRHGAGKHMWNITLQNYGQILYWSFISTHLYRISIYALRVSIALQYKAIFAPQRNRRSSLHWAICFTIGADTLYTAVATAMLIARCYPIESAWDSLLTHGGGEGPICFIDKRSFGYICAACNCFFDLVIMLIPQRAIWSLKLPVRQKLRVSALFMLGFVALAASASRFCVIAMDGRTSDYSFLVAWETLQCCLEIWVGMICTCLPFAPIFVRSVREGLTARLAPARLRNRLSWMTGTGHDDEENNGGDGRARVVAEEAEEEEEDEKAGHRSHTSSAAGMLANRASPGTHSPSDSGSERLIARARADGIRHILTEEKIHSQRVALTEYQREWRHKQREMERGMV